MPAERDFRISSKTLSETQFNNVYQLLYMGIGFLGSFPAECVSRTEGGSTSNRVRIVVRSLSNLT